MSRRVEVDRQLDDLIENLETRIEHWFMFHTHWDFWEDMDAHPVDFLNGLENEIDMAFDPIQDAYDGISEVYDLLDNLRVVIQNAAWAAVNVPFPRDPYRYLDVITSNLLVIMTEQVIDVRAAMLISMHNIEVIQRNWRKCISDPHFLACRKRLRREALELCL